MDTKTSSNWTNLNDHWYWYFVGMAPCENLNESCPTCRKLGHKQCPPVKKVTLLEEVVDCKFQKLGCPMLLMLDHREDHELRCEHRPVFCPHFDCQPQKIQFALTTIANHYNSTHPKSIQFQKHNLHFPGNFRIKMNPSKVLYHNALLYYNKKLLYVFIGRFKINEFPNSLKACLITTLVKEKAKNLNCSMKLLLNENEIVSYNGNVFSVDDMEDIHSWKSGGLIYPKDVFNLDIKSLDMVVEISFKREDEIQFMKF